jgi:capsular polysaccharide biosynthesis protein
MQNTIEINLKNFLKILAKRKIAFLIAFIIVFVLGLTFTFLVSPEYSSTSKISLKNNELVFSDELYEYLPEVADSLLIIPSYKEDQEIYYIVDKLDIVPEELNSEYVISNTVKALQNKIDAQQLIKSINAILDRWTGILTITTYSKTPDLAFAINKNILEYFIEFKKMQIEKSYNIALEKVDGEIASTGKSLAVLQDSADENNKGLIALEETNREFKKYNNLIVIKENLLGNKDFYIDRIEVIDSPEISNVRNESNYLRNILFSLMAAVSIGIIIVFIVNYFKTPKKSDL